MRITHSGDQHVEAQKLPPACAWYGREARELARLFYYIILLAIITAVIDPYMSCYICLRLDYICLLICRVCHSRPLNDYPQCTPQELAHWRLWQM